MKVVEKPKAYPNHPTDPAEVTQKYMWFDLITARISSEEIDCQFVAVLVGLWKALKSEQQFRHAPTAPIIPVPSPQLLRQSLQGYNPVWGGCLPHPRCKTQGKTASRWGLLEAMGGLTSAHCSLVPRTQTKGEGSS